MSEAWYIVKQSDGHCEIMTAVQLKMAHPTGNNIPEPERWGPFASEAEAIARRVGLIRAGKCQPV